MTTNELLIKMIFDRWEALLKNADGIINTLTDEQLLNEIAPGKNRGVYLLGHMIAVHDDMLPLLSLGEKQHAELFEIFLKSPDKSVEAIPSVQELREVWKNQLEVIAPKLKSITAEQWFEKHSAVSAEDFSKEPHRNKLNILITRTTHLAYHVGQLILLK
jgi:DinB superfamily